MGVYVVMVMVMDREGVLIDQIFNVNVFDLSFLLVQVGIIMGGISNVRGLVVEGNYVYVFDNDSLRIFYVNNVNVFELIVSVRFVQFGCKDCFVGNLQDIVVVGNYVYVILDWGGFQIVDVINKMLFMLLIDDMEGYYYKVENESNYQILVVGGNYVYIFGWV